MTCTPVHPNLAIRRSLTPREMLDALDYEGMFGVGPRDVPVGMWLRFRGLAICELWDKGRGWHVCRTEKPR